MDPTAALIAGLAAGLAIAVQIGAVSLLLIETAIAAGPRPAVAAGLGVATVDLLFAAAAAAAGGTAGAVLAAHSTELRLVAAAVLAGIALTGMVELARKRRAEPVGAAGGPLRPGTAGHYGRFVAITAANPLTIASFAALATSLPLGSAAAAAAFAAGAGIASAGWHVLLTVTAGHAGRRMTPRMQRGLAIGGRVAVLAIAAHLALG
jgi:threonine/homoserine/homoserine lactone efflux protein